MTGYWQPATLDQGNAQRIAASLGRILADLHDHVSYLQYRETGACDDPATQAANDIASAIPELEAAQLWLRGEITNGPAPSLLRGEGEPGQTG